MELSSDRKLLKETIRQIAEKYPATYWRRKDDKREYPGEFVSDLMNSGWMGVNIPSEYGGAGLGVTESSIVLEEIANAGGGLNGAGAAHACYFNVTIIAKSGSQELKQQFLPKIAKGTLSFQALAITEPGAGFDTPNIKTFAEKQGDNYIINGNKVFISRVKHSDLMLLLARTERPEKVKRRTDGLTLFLVEMQSARDSIKAQEIPNNVRRTVDTNELVIENLKVPASNIVGEVGKGFYHILDVVNAERINLSAEAIGLGRLALQKAVDYSKQRVVFGRPIGQNQAIAHPLSDVYMRLEAADLLRYRACELYDSQKPCGKEANSAKYLAAEACMTACDRAVQTFGGYGLSVECDVERYWREARLYLIAPISQEMVLNYISNNVLTLPKSY